MHSSNFPPCRGENVGLLHLQTLFMLRSMFMTMPIFIAMRICYLAALFYLDVWTGSAQTRQPEHNGMIHQRSNVSADTQDLINS